MYRVRTELIGTEETITRPVALKVIQDLKRILGIAHDTVVRIGDKDIDTTSGSTGVASSVSAPRTEEMFVVYEETAADTTGVTNTHTYPNTLPIYHDPELDAHIRPVLDKRKIIFTVLYSNSSKSRVTSIVNKFKLFKDESYRYHDLEYHYALPMTTIEIVSTIHALKNTYNADPMDLDQYIEETFDSRVEIVNSSDGVEEKGHLVIREATLGVLGYITTDLKDIRKELDADTGKWGVEFEYVIELDIPTQFFNTYPLAVYNQMMPQHLVPTRRQGQPATGRRTSDIDSIAHLTKQVPPFLKLSRGRTYLTVPRSDTFTLSSPVASYVNIMSVFCIIDTDTPNDLFYMDEIPNITIASNILDLMLLEKEYTSETFATLFKISLYNGARETNNAIVLTEVSETIDGVTSTRIKVSTTTPMEVSGRYRVVFSILTDLSMLGRDRLVQLKSNLVIADADVDTTVSGYIIDRVFNILSLTTDSLAADYNYSNSTDPVDILCNGREGLGRKWRTKQLYTTLVGFVSDIE